ncbi:MAG: gamma-glutamylcyclotransferase [Candidatus Competibacterales bacterium]
MSLPPGDLWVFGYGSLLWKPGFAHLEVQPARLHGYHRALCVWSWVHRGTPEWPGLVFGLDLGGACIGRAFRVAAAERDAVVDYLYRREMVTKVYKPRLHRVRLATKAQVTALGFVVDRRHHQYAGRLNAEQAAAVVRVAAGQSGPNPEYVVNTAKHLVELGIRDAYLQEVVARLAAPGAGGTP